MTKKYKLDPNDTITVDEKTLYRIVALKDFADVAAGEKGGYIEHERNLPHYGNSWVFGNACVFGNAWITTNARVSGNAWVFGNAYVSGDARVSGNAWVFGNAYVSGDARVSGNAWIGDNAHVCNSEDYFCTQSFGSCGRTTTFFREKKGWGVICGCFSGTVDKFRQRVKKTYGDSLIAQEYLLIADLMELRIKRIDGQEGNDANPTIV